MSSTYLHERFLRQYGHLKGVFFTGICHTGVWERDLCGRGLQKASTRYPSRDTLSIHLRRSCGHVLPGFGARITTQGGVAGTFCRVLVPGQPPKADLQARFAGFPCPDNHLRRICGHGFQGFGARTTTRGGVAGTFCRVLVPGQPPKADLRARFARFWCPDHLGRSCGHVFPGYRVRTTT